MEPMFKQEIQQMMYIAGEPLDVSTQTIAFIENIVHAQVVEMLTAANDLANRRGSRAFSNADLIFQIRHNAIQLERLRTVLAWKNIRKTVKDSDEKDSFGDEAALEVEASSISSDPPAKSSVVAASPLPSSLGMESVFSVLESNSPGQDDADGPVRSDISFEELRQNDERTRNMTPAEYAMWTEYRHASFTWRKKKRFCEWSGLGSIAQNRPNDDVFDILGFLTVEMVKSLTSAALDAQRREGDPRRSSCAASQKAKDRALGVFSEAADLRRPIEIRHVRLAYQRMHARPKKYRALGPRRRVS